VPDRRVDRGVGVLGGVERHRGQQVLDGGQRETALAALREHGCGGDQCRPAGGFRDQTAALRPRRRREEVRDLGGLRRQAAPFQESVDAVAVGRFEGVVGGAGQPGPRAEEPDEPGAAGGVGLGGEGGDGPEGADREAVGDLLEASPGGGVDAAFEEEPHGLVSGQGGDRVVQRGPPGVEEAGEGRGADQERRAVEADAVQERADELRVRAVGRERGDPGLRQLVQ
jgi:hypothetical protein